MSIDSTAATTGAAASAATTRAGQAADKLGVDYQSFLTLLTAQVANQDPLKPMDSTTFVSQLAQLSQVEQSIQTNTNLEGIGSRLDATGSMADVQLLGREVTVPSDRVTLKDGGARYDYELNDGAESVSAEIRTPDGTLLRRITGLPAEADGRHRLTWDGKDDEGLPVPDGQFTVSIAALDEAGEQVSYTGYASATVQRLVFRDGAPVLLLSDGSEAASSSVTAVE